MSQRRYSRDELEAFFAAVDECLDEPARVVLIGGSAVIIAYGVSTTTIDVDTFNNASKALERAIEAAKLKTGMSPPVARAGPAQAPEGYEDRLVRHNPSARFLELMVLERHDLVISKALRGDERDRQHVAAMHLEQPLDLATLVDRFKNDMLPSYVGEPTPVIDYFLWVVEELFGELSRSRAERTLRGR